MSQTAHGALTIAPALRQRGQALIESLIAISVLGVLWGAIHWLSQYQDIALSALHASRHVAFLASRDTSVLQQPDTSSPYEAPHPIIRFFSGAAHRWTDRHAAPVFDARTSLKVKNLRTRTLSARAQPGAEHGDAATLRQEWFLEDQGVFHGLVQLTFPDPQSPARNTSRLLSLAPFDNAFPSLQRSTSILTNGGHASSDAATQSRVGASHYAWAAAQSRSSQAGRDIAERAHAVDNAWNRGTPEFDWLQPWGGRVPTEYLENHEGR